MDERRGDKEARVFPEKRVADTRFSKAKPQGGKRGKDLRGGEGVAQ